MDARAAGGQRLQPAVLTSDGLLTLQSPTGVEDRGRTSSRRLTHDGVVVAGLVVAAALLRLPTLWRSYWVDEGISVGIASHPLATIPSLLRLDGSPPLWYFVLHFWLRLVGSSAVATHTLSLLVSLAVTPLAYWSGRALFGRTAGLYAAALATVNPFLGWYATENRMYTLVVAISCVAITLAVRAVRDRSGRDAVGAVIAYIALDYTHDWGLYLSAVTVGYLAVRALLAADRRLLGWVLAGGAVIALAYLPWLPTFLDQASATAAPWAVPPVVGDLFADPSTVVGGTAGVVVVPVLVAAVVATRRRRCRGSRQAVTVLVGITLGVTVLGWLSAQVEPSWTVRYLAVTVPGWILAAAGSLSAGRAGRAALAGVCMVLGCWSVVGALLPDAHPGDAKDNAASIAAAATPTLRPGDVVVVSQTEQVPVLAYYLPAGLTYLNPMGPVTDPTVVDWRHIVSRLSNADACATVEPTIERAPIGARVLEVLPLDPVGASGSAWSRAAHRQVVRIAAVLGRDPALQLRRSFTEATSPKPYSPVIAVLFVKVSARTSCG